MNCSDTPHTNISPGARVGLAIVVETAVLSFLAVLALLLYVVINSLRNTYRPPTRHGIQPWYFLRSTVDYYFASLLFNDLIQAMGSILDARWVQTGLVEAGAYCTTQGAVKQVGNVGVALATLTITCHTFAVLFFRWRAPDTKWLPLGIIAVIWVFIICITAIPSSTLHDPPYYGPTTYWCWIDPKYRRFQIGLEYAIFWFTAAVNFALYIPLFFCLRGNIVVEYEYLNGKRKMRIRWVNIKANDAWNRSADQRREQMDAARQMVVYPVAYVFVITPISIARWIQFTTGRVGPGVASFGAVVFGSSGVINVMLYLATRPAILRSILGHWYHGEEAGQGKPRAAMTMQGVTVRSSASSRVGYGGELELDGVPARSRDHGDEVESQLPVSSGDQSRTLSGGEWSADRSAGNSWGKG